MLKLKHLLLLCFSLYSFMTLFFCLHYCFFCFVCYGNPFLHFFLCARVCVCFSESLMLFRCAHFAIYDGHGGRLAAEYAQKHLHQSVISAGLPRELVCLSMHLVDCSNLCFLLKMLDFLLNFFGIFRINNVFLL